MEPFRFTTKKEYEDELARLTRSIFSSDESDPDQQDMYEELMEEYLIFCSEEDS